MAEYAVLFPGAILVIIAAAWWLGPSLADIYRHNVNILLGQRACFPSYDHSDNSICDQNEDCEMSEYEDLDSGSYTFDDALSIDSVVIKAGKTYEIRRDDPYQFIYTTDDGCYEVTFMTNSVSWVRIGSGSTCQGVSHIDYWSRPICAE